MGRAGPRAALSGRWWPATARPSGGSRTKDGTATALFGVLEHRHRLVLTQRAIDGGNEIAAFTATLETLPEMGDVLVTADALHAAGACGRTQDSLSSLRVVARPMLGRSEGNPPNSSTSASSRRAGTAAISSARRC